MRADAVEEAVAHRGREVAHELGQEVGVVGQLRREQLFLERDLGVAEQHGELGHGEPEARVVPLGELFVARQPLDLAVEVAGGLERADEARVHLFHRRPTCVRALSSARFWR